MTLQQNKTILCKGQGSKTQDSPGHPFNFGWQQSKGKQTQTICCLILFYILRLCPRRWDKGAGWSTIPLRLRFFNPKLILLFYTKVKESEE